MVKMRWANRRTQIEFEANEPDEFHTNCRVALREFKILTERIVHRGEIHKTVHWFESAQLGIYDQYSKQWYNPEGEHDTIDTQSFGRITIARHFTVETPHVEADNRDNGIANNSIHLICQDPLRFEILDMTKPEDSGRLWNLCIHAHQHAENVHSFISGFMDDFEKLTGENSHG